MIVADLVGENCKKANDSIAADLFVRFIDEVSTGFWAKEVKRIVVKRFQALNRTTWCVRKYPISELVKKHKNNSKFSCLRFFSCFELCIFVPLRFLFVLFGERFYEGLISILDSGKCLGR